MIAFSALSAAVLTLVLLPLLPALRELRSRTDAQPLRVGREHSNDIRYFARRFYSEILPQLAGQRTQAEPAEALEFGLFDSRATFKLIGTDARGAGARNPRGMAQYLVLSPGHLTLASRMTYGREIYSEGDIHAGTQCSYEALLGKGNIALGSHTTLRRWLQARGDVTIGAHSVLQGRIAAGGSLRLSADTEFQRLQARVISFAETGVDAAPQAKAALAPACLVDALDISGSRHLFRADVSLPDGSEFIGDLVVQGALRIGRGCLVRGSTKSYKTTVLYPGAVVEGSLVSHQEIVIGKNCRVRGPVIAEGAIYLASGCLVGSEDAPTTINAPHIRAAQGARAYGTVWARERGYVEGAEECGAGVSTDGSHGSH